MQEFELWVKDRPYKIGVDGQHLKVEEFELTYQIVEAEGDHFFITIDGILYEVELRESEDGKTIAIIEGQELPIEAIGLVRGRPTPKKDEKPTTAAAPEMVKGALTAMMPSKVIAVHVKEGDQVKADQVIMILEAMKMESELKSPQDGTVVAIHCAPGDSVDPGVPLVVIE
jgi:biotin carboxyl carrier protein